MDRDGRDRRGGESTRRRSRVEGGGVGAEGGGVARRRLGARARRANWAARAERTRWVLDGECDKRLDPDELADIAESNRKRRAFEERFASGEYGPAPEMTRYRYEGEPPRAPRSIPALAGGRDDVAADEDENDEKRRRSSSGANSSEQTKVETNGDRAASPVNSKSEGRKLCELEIQEKFRKGDASTLPTFYGVLKQGTTPEELLQGEDARWWSAFEEQGAMVLKISDGWDLLDDNSALCDLSWVGTKKLKLTTLGHDYQYLRQNLPDSKTGLLQPFTAMLDYDKEGEVGSFVEDFQERCRTHADQFRLMGVDAREAWFMQQVHSGFPLQFPYLQGIAMEALLRNIRTVAPSEGMQRHPWDPRLLGERPPSVLRRCLKLCEASHFIKKSQSEAQTGPVNNVVAQTAEEAKQEELKATGGVATTLDPAVMQRRVERREGKKKASRHSSAGVLIESNEENAMRYVEEQSNKQLWGVGIVTPWLYYMGVGSIFPLHFEDYAFGSANVILARPDSQSAVVWYSIPRADLYLLHTYLQETLGAEYTVDVLEMRRLWLDPIRIEEWNRKRKKNQGHIRVYRHVQRAGDYVVTDYGSVHWGVNLGDGWKAAVNFAYVDWKIAAKEVDEVYRRLERETGMSRHHRCCPKFHDLAEFFSDERISQSTSREPVSEC